MNLTVDDVAKDLRCSRKTVRAMCADGRITPNFKVGRAYRIPAATLERFKGGYAPGATPGRRGAWRAKA